MSKGHALLISLTIALAADRPVAAAVLCVKHDDGTLAVREACKGNETPLDPAALGLQGPPGPALSVRDSDGRFVGLLFDPVLERVARRVGNETVRLDVGVEGFRESSSITLAYGTVDCSGEAFFTPTLALTTLTRLAFISLARQTAYFAVPPAAIRPIRSSLEFPADHDSCTETGGTFMLPDGCCRVNELLEFHVFGVGSLDLGEFVPPFHAEGP